MIILITLREFGKNLQNVDCITISPGLAYIYPTFFQTITEYRSTYLLSSVLMMFVGTCEITGDDEADHDDVPGDDNDDSDDVAVITPGGR